MFINVSYKINSRKGGKAERNLCGLCSINSASFALQFFEVSQRPQSTKDSITKKN